MNQLSPGLARILETLESWPLERQEAAAEVLERMGALATTPYRLSAEERADLEEALDEARRGEFASDIEVGARIMCSIERLSRLPYSARLTDHPTSAFSPSASILIWSSTRFMNPPAKFTS